VTDTHGWTAAMAVWLSCPEPQPPRPAPTGANAGDCKYTSACAMMYGTSTDPAAMAKGRAEYMLAALSLDSTSESVLLPPALSFHAAVRRDAGASRAH